jgi:hypothetical protein
MPNESANCSNFFFDRNVSPAVRPTWLTIWISPEAQLLDQNAIIDTATDGSHDTDSGIIAYGWVVAINEMVVAEGLGPAQASPALAESFRAEAYGLYAATTFLCLIRKHYAKSNRQYKWFFHIDSKTLITRMERYTEEKSTSKQVHDPDIDITNSVARNLIGLEAQFQHVKSHQNRQKTKEKLSFPARLNVRADELAQNQRARMREPATKVTTEFHHLIIGKQYFTRDSQRWLIDAASRIPIRQYYHDKYGWSTTTFNEIDWDMQYKVLIRYGTNDQRRILKFVHDWLPTNSRLARERSSNTQRCKLCHYISEDAMHVFNCRHAKQTETRHAFLAKLNKIMLILDPEKSTILEAIELSSQNANWKPEIETRGMRAQTLIGWQQIYRGRFAKGLIREFRLKETAASAKAAKQSLSQKILKLIWDTFLQLWKQRNELIFGENDAQKQDAKRDT